MSLKFPKHWATSTFGELNKLSARAIDTTHFPDSLFELYSVPSFPTGEPEHLLGADIGSIKQAVAPNDVLVCKINPRINRVWQVKPNAGLYQIASSEWIIFRNPEIDARFYKYYFKSNFFRKAICSELTGVGGSLTRAQPKRVAKFLLPVPALAEQSLIAEKLDSLLAEVAKCRARLESLPAELEEFRQAVVLAAVSGDLLITAELSSAPSEAKKTSLAELCNDRVITYGVIKLGDEQEDGTPCLRTSNVRWLNIDTTGVKKISPDISLKHSRTVLQGGEVLVNVRGTLGGVAVVPHEMKGWNVSREIAVIPVDSSKVSPHFLALYIAASSTQELLTRMERGVAYVGINLEDLRTLEIAAPSLEAQNAILERVRYFFDISEQLEKQIEEAISRVENLEPVILKAAFQGELIARSDKPSSSRELLNKMQLISPIKAPELILENAAMERPDNSSTTPYAKKSLREIIATHPDQNYSFRDLELLYSGKYEDLKRELFYLLGESPALITQEFDSKLKEMRFLRSKR